MKELGNDPLDTRDKAVAEQLKRMGVTGEGSKMPDCADRLCFGHVSKSRIGGSQ
jgi:hypothetical protein